MARRCLLLVAAALLCLPATAAAQEPLRDGLTVAGIGRARVEPPARENERSIQTAVDEATRQALPRAVADARRNAAILAEASGLRLGAIRAVEQNPFLAFEFGGYGPEGFCQELPVRRRRGADRPRRPRVRTVCRVPEEARVLVSVNFATG